MTDFFANEEELPNDEAAKYVKVARQTWDKWRSVERRKRPEDRDPRRWVPFRTAGSLVYYRREDLEAHKLLNTIL